MRQSTNTKSYSIRGVSVDIIGLDGLLTPIRANDIGIIDYMTVGIRAGFGVSAGSVTEFHSKIGPVAQAQLKAPVPLFLSVNPFIGYTSLSSKSLNSVKAPGVDLSLRYMFNHRYRWNEGRPKIESAADDGWGLTLEYGYMGKFGKDYIHTVGVGVLYRFF
jgi:hypothetical protein